MAAISPCCTHRTRGVRRLSSKEDTCDCITTLGGCQVFRLFGYTQTGLNGTGCLASCFSERSAATELGFAGCLTFL